jgi:ribonuclease HI
MIIYTDGACSKNGQKINTGGFGVVVLDKNENIIYNYSKLSNNTTNNREELKAILYAMLKHGCRDNILEDRGKSFTPPIVYSDSAYAVNTLTNWMFGWARNGWLKSDNKQPENLDLIQAYYEWYQKGFRIDLRKVKGHAGNKWNDMADGLATGKIKPIEI